MPSEAIAVGKDGSRRGLTAPSVFSASILFDDLPTRPSVLRRQAELSGFRSFTLSTSKERHGIIVLPFHYVHVYYLKIQGKQHYKS